MCGGQTTANEEHTRRVAGSRGGGRSDAPPTKHTTRVPPRAKNRRVVGDYITALGFELRIRGDVSRRSGRGRRMWRIKGGRRPQGREISGDATVRSAEGAGGDALDELAERLERAQRADDGRGVRGRHARQWHLESVPAVRSGRSSVVSEHSDCGLGSRRRGATMPPRLARRGSRARRRRGDGGATRAAGRARRRGSRWRGATMPPRLARRGSRARRDGRARMM